jgi:hypothetical protein
VDAKKTVDAEAAKNADETNVADEKLEDYTTVDDKLLTLVTALSRQVVALAMASSWC